MGTYSDRTSYSSRWIKGRFDTLKRDDHGLADKFSSRSHSFGRSSKKMSDTKDKTSSHFSDVDSGFGSAFSESSESSYKEREDDVKNIEEHLERMQIKEEDKSDVCPEELVNTQVIEHRDWWKQRDECGETLLHNAVIAERLDIIVYILRQVKHKEDLDIMNKFRQTPLHLAVLGNLPKVVHLLVGLGASVGVKDRSGNTPLHLACSEGNVECLKLLTAPLHTDQRHSKHTVNTLSQMNAEGLPCLHLAFLNNRLDVFSYLKFKLGCDIDITEGKHGKTVLHIAVESGDLNTVRTLVQVYGAQTDSQMFDGRTPIELAHGRGYTHLVQYLQTSLSR